MTTALQVIEGAAEEIGVKTAESNLESHDFQVCLNRMNNLLAQWADSGLTPAFVRVSNSTDTVAIDDNAVDAAQLALAIRIAPTFQRLVTPDLRESAREAKQALETSVVHIGEVAYPDTMPTGSGNDCGDTYRNDRFFESNKKANF